ncbi:DUF1320 domain-containing protein [Castellaniella caeni]|uniref:DUF1320 domain-containing protein n=1 Tax=Castellaniella caeni TaxID=266123 RepID=UPI0015E11353|nr:DUF1320 domain-containing protein [Castellaniella caeni]
MQAYATSDDFVAAFGQDEAVRLTATYDAPDQVDVTTLAGALDRATIRVDAITSFRYPAGFKIVPRLLTGITCDLARYELATSGGRVLTEEVDKRREEADKLLRMLADGRVKLGLDIDDQQVDWGHGVQQLPADTTLRDALEDY